jgi:hypothetical protein
MHELSHLIHQHALPGGLDNIYVMDAFARAEESGLYGQVLRRDWAGKDVDCDMAYAMVDHREFFAEMSVAYWCREYNELDGEAHYKMERASPPICAPSVQLNITSHRQTLEKWTLSGKRFGSSTSKELKMPHCNKFYPFTSGQLHRFDRDTFRTMDKLWREISTWDDPFGRLHEECCFSIWQTSKKKRIDVVESVTISDTVDL